MSFLLFLVEYSYYVVSLKMMIDSSIHTHLSDYEHINSLLRKSR